MIVMDIALVGVNVNGVLLQSTSNAGTDDIDDAGLWYVSVVWI